MEKYRETIRKRRAWLCLPILLSSALAVYAVFFAGDKIHEGAGAMALSFATGIFTSLGVLAAIFYLRLGRLLRDEAQLQQHYNRAHDERLRAIRAKAGMPMLLINALVLLAAAAIAAFYSETVFATLVLASLAQLTIGMVVKLVCMRTM